jgi:hypothetical protein
VIADSRACRRVLAIVALAVGLTACSGSSGGASPSSQPPLGFRSAPSYLPKQTQPVDRVVTASTGHSQLAVQGISVAVDLPSGHALATVTGPKVPPFVAPPPPQVTATFAVTFTRVTGTIPVRLTDFTITDQLGRTFHPTLVSHEQAPPTNLTTGHSVTFHVTAVMPTGEGRIYWTPSGSTPLVGWDFIVEND